MTVTFSLALAESGGERSMLGGVAVDWAVAAVAGGETDGGGLKDVGVEDEKGVGGRLSGGMKVAGAEDFRDRNGDVEDRRDLEEVDIFEGVTCRPQATGFAAFCPSQRKGKKRGCVRRSVLNFLLARVPLFFFFFLEICMYSFLSFT